MLKKDIEELRLKATSFLRLLDSKAKDLNITLVSLIEGKMVFLDNDSGLQVVCDLVTDSGGAIVESVPSKAQVGEPSILVGPSKKTH